MGLYDRDYTRENDSWLPPSAWDTANRRANRGPRSFTIALIVINVAVFFADVLISGNAAQGSRLADWFAVNPDTLLRPWEWYRLLSYGFVHSLGGIGHLAFNMIGLFFFGRPVEERLGSREFLRFYLVAIVLGGLVSSARWVISSLVTGAPLQSLSGGTIGASGGVMAVTILFAFYFPNAIIYLMMVIPIKAWVAAVLFVALNLLGLASSDAPVAYDVHLAGAALAAVYYRRSWNFGFLASNRAVESVGNLFRRRPSLRLHDPERALAKEEAEADRILDKIQANGLDSLTSAERRTLEKHSRRKRANRQKSGR